MNVAGTRIGTVVRHVGPWLSIAIGVLAIYFMVDVIRAPYGSEVIYQTGEAADVSWDPTSRNQRHGSAGDVSERGPEFVFERRDAPGLAEIRALVLPVVDGARSDLERATAIRRWIRARVDYGNAVTDPEAADLAADDILRDAESGVKSPCNRLAALFVTSCEAAGIPARMVHLSTGRGQGHFVAEVWLRGQKRWVMMDPSLNYYASIDGVPASVLALHRAVRNGRTPAVTIQRDGADTLPAPFGRPFSRNAELMDYFRSFALVNRNDFLTHRSKLDAHVLLVWVDGDGPAHPARSEVLKAWLKGSLAVSGLLLSIGLLLLSRRGRNSDRKR